jgi:hypothetical protein
MIFAIPLGGAAWESTTSIIAKPLRIENVGFFIERYRNAARK